MEEKLKNNVLYVCTLIEYIGRKTSNRRATVVDKMGLDMIRHQLEFADVNHCLGLDQVAEEVIEDAHILQGDFDTVKSCNYGVPSAISIGKVYQRIIWSLNGKNDLAQTMYQVFHSNISDRISDFNSSLYYSPSGYLIESYRAGVLLED